MSSFREKDAISYLPKIRQHNKHDTGTEMLQLAVQETLDMAD